MFVFLPLIPSISILLFTLWVLVYKYKTIFPSSRNNKVPKITELPIVTSTGQIVNSVEELDTHLEFLQNQLDEKEKELETSKMKMISTQDNLKTINDTASEVTKYYLKLKLEINKNEREYGELKSQIEDCKLRQLRLREEVSENVKYYTNMLTNIDSRAGISANEEYEVIARIPVKSCSRNLSEKLTLI